MLLLQTSCSKDPANLEALSLTELYSGSRKLDTEGIRFDAIALDQPIDLIFNRSIDPESTDAGVSLTGPSGSKVPLDKTYFNDNRQIRLSLQTLLNEGTAYTLSLNTALKSASGDNYPQQTSYILQTLTKPFQLLAAEIGENPVNAYARTLDVPLSPKIKLTFSTAIDPEAVRPLLRVLGDQVPGLQLSATEEGKVLEIRFDKPLKTLAGYSLDLKAGNYGAAGQPGPAFTFDFFTEVNTVDVFPRISDEELLTLVQQHTFRYFWDYGHPVSGLARERAAGDRVVTIGGSGFGLMAMIVAVERGFITRTQAMERWNTMINFLATADRFHGVWPHWMDGATGEVIPFSSRDNGGDLVETTFMAQALLTLRQYLNPSNAAEKSLIDRINLLWEGIEWTWYTKGGEKQLYWHWSPDQNFAINLKIKGHNETQIVYVLAAASPTHSIDLETYQKGYAASGGMVKNRSHYGLDMPLGNSNYGGPLFFTHYSYLGLDPRMLKDEYADYWQQNVNHSLIQYFYCADNPLSYPGYSQDSWGLTASYSPDGYSAHSPDNDKGVISPTAAISSIPYTPEESLAAIRHFYYKLGDKLWGPYGFYDAFSPHRNWVANDYLAIDQGPQICMIENYRTKLLWNLFMSAPEVRAGLEKLNFTF